MYPIAGVYQGFIPILRITENQPAWCTFNRQKLLWGVSTRAVATIIGNQFSFECSVDRGLTALDTSAPDDTQLTADNPVLLNYVHENKFTPCLRRRACLLNVDKKFQKSQTLCNIY